MLGVKYMSGDFNTSPVISEVDKENMELEWAKEALAL